MSDESKPSGIVGCTAGLGAGWMPIDSAPHTGRILAWMGGHVKIAWWNDQKYHGKPKPYWESEGHNGVMRDRESQPDWWMPLPEAPNDGTQRPQEEKLC